MPIFSAHTVEFETCENGVLFTFTPPHLVYANETTLSSDRDRSFQFNISDEKISGEHFARVKSMVNNKSVVESALREDENHNENFKIMANKNDSLSKSDRKNIAKSTYWFGVALYPEIKKYVFGSSDPKDKGKSKTDFEKELRLAGTAFLNKAGNPKDPQNYKKFARKMYMERHNGEIPKEPFAKKGIDI